MSEREIGDVEVGEGVATMLDQMSVSLVIPDFDEDDEEAREKGSDEEGDDEAAGDGQIRDHDVICTGCGAVLGVEDRFCIRCGNRYISRVDRRSRMDGDRGSALASQKSVVASSSNLGMSAPVVVVDDKTLAELEDFFSKDFSDESDEDDSDGDEGEAKNIDKVDAERASLIHAEVPPVPPRSPEGEPQNPPANSADSLSSSLPPPLLSTPLSSAPPPPSPSSQDSAAPTPSSAQSPPPLLFDFGGCEFA